VANYGGVMSQKELNMRWIFLSLILTHFGTYAESCFVTAEMKEEFNSKYSDKVIVDVSVVGSKFTVTINLPDEMEDQSLYSVLLASDSIEDPTFIAPLEVFHEGEQLVTWYEIDAGLIRKHFIIIGLKEYCAPSIIKEVLYQ